MDSVLQTFQHVLQYEYEMVDSQMHVPPVITTSLFNTLALGHFTRVCIFLINTIYDLP